MYDVFLWRIQCTSHVLSHGDRLRHFKINQETNTGLYVSELDSVFKSFTWIYSVISIMNIHSNQLIVSVSISIHNKIDYHPIHVHGCISCWKTSGVFFLFGGYYWECICTERWPAVFATVSVSGTSGHVWISVWEVLGPGGAVPSPLPKSQPQRCGNPGRQWLWVSALILSQNRSSAPLPQ